MGGVAIMKLWIITQSFNDNYDTYDSAVVAAETAEDAQKILPERGNRGQDDDDRMHRWAPVEHVRVEYLGEAAPGWGEGTILGSFNAG